MPALEERSGAPEVIILEYSDLLAGKDLTAQVAAAFGPCGLGILAVRGVPGLVEARRRLLPLARELALQPEDILAKYESEKSLYNFGWSRGRETFQGKPDTAKGSFYANPIFDDPADGDEEVRDKFPWAASRNIWPKELPGLEGAVKEMGRLVYDTARTVVSQCDRLIAEKFGEASAKLEEVTFERSRMALGRLLHYYALRDSGDGGDTSTWCGWHNDNSTITGLVPAMWINHETGEEMLGVKSDGGLYVKSRTGVIQKVSFPSDCLGFQIGEAAQILSGGLLSATPHHVRGHLSRTGEALISRETFALFIEPQWDQPIGPPAGVSLEQVLHNEEQVLIPPLSKRLRPDPETLKVEFGKLLGDSFQEYYKHNNEGSSLLSAASTQPPSPVLETGGLEEEPVSCA
eukprot:TRINITY_DN12070_c0_g2_i1.p1 TRINITY_DN12070_c0_g2~~TRINITY_DN12070_c0_g2_i1.p1  ORF type:complete len:404 (+),score=84.26 TRINITY_DN12070_c0_g2_i1:72-1283(+)